MAKSKVTLQMQGASILQDDQVMLGEAYIKQWKIPANQSLLLRFGASKQPVKVISAPRSDALRMSEALMKKLALHQGSQLRLHYKASTHCLSIGPLIGVMVSRVYPGSSDRPFGAITSFCKELIDACRQLGAFVYFFTPNEISSSSATISGWSYSNLWYKSVFPVPDVVHNRLTSRKLENKPSVQHFMREVKSRYSTSVFNEKFLNKTEVFQALKNDSSLLKYLPESYAFKNYQMLKSMCGKYAVVFLKPVRGSLGKGIIRVSRQKGGSYVCHFTNVNGATKQSYPNLAKVFFTLSSKMKATRYQIQQGLQLIEIGKRPVDFRVLVQKNAHGKWAITSAVARIAGHHHFVSNLARGGRLSSVKDALPKSDLSAEQRQSIHSKLRRAALDIAQGLERQIPYHFGELGIDLAVDAHGRVWLLEVNSKPSKNDNTPLTDKKIRPSVIQLVQYAKHLSGF